jgi:hypothetical protein
MSQASDALMTFLKERVCGLYQIFRPSIAVHQHTFRGIMNIKHDPIIDKIVVTEELKAPGVGHWELSGFLTARSKTLFAIISTSNTNPAPETKYITSVFIEGNALMGFASDVHNASRFYVTPLYIDKKSINDNLHVDIVSNEIIKKEYSQVYQFFNHWWDNSYNSFILYDD